MSIIWFLKKEERGESCSARTVHKCECVCAWNKVSVFVHCIVAPGHEVIVMGALYRTLWLLVMKLLSWAHYTEHCVCAEMAACVKAWMCVGFHSICICICSLYSIHICVPLNTTESLNVCCVSQYMYMYLSTVFLYVFHCTLLRALMM